MISRMNSCKKFENQRSKSMGGPGDKKQRFVNFPYQQCDSVNHESTDVSAEFVKESEDFTDDSD